MRKYFFATGMAMLCLLASCVNSSPAPPPTNVLEVSKAPESAVTVKIDKFNDVEGLRTALSNIGIGELRPWRNDSQGWISSSNYFPFGNASDANGMENNLAFYLESDNESYVKTVKIILNINNASERKGALLSFSSAIEDTFKAIGMMIPPSLLASVETGKEFTFFDTTYKVSTIKFSDNIESWKFILASE